MDPTLIATATVAALGPAWPFIKTALTGASEKFGELAADATAKLGLNVYRMLVPAIEKRPALREALSDAAANPSNVDTLGALRIQIRKAVEVDSILHSELLKLVGDRSVETANASGVGAIAITGGVSQSSLSTNVLKNE
jgi:hypothetical protein